MLSNRPGGALIGAKIPDWISISWRKEKKKKSFSSIIYLILFNQYVFPQ